MSDNPKPSFSLLNHIKKEQTNVNTGQVVTPSATPKPSFSIAGIKKANPTPVVQQALPAGQPRTFSDGSKPKEAPAQNASSAIVQVNQSSLHAQMDRLKERMDAGKAALDHLYSEDHADFATLLDRFDSLFDEHMGLNDFNVTASRNYVEVIMKQLKEDPNLDSLMLDRDVANIIEFVRKVKGVAIEAANTKKEKAEKTAANKTKKKASRFDDADLEGLDFTVPAKAIGGPKAGSLDDLANLDLDVDSLKI